jgi:ribosome recycling factor
MNHPIIDQAKLDFEKAVSHLKNEYNALQIGRASSTLVENLTVEAYGTPTPLKGLASISTPDSKTIQIQPWDKGLLAAIEKSIIAASELGFNPVNDGVVVRINIPNLTEERRLSLKKLVHEKAEEAKISMRNARHKVHNEFKKLKEASEITEDDFYSYDKSLQEVLSDFTKQIDALSVEKEKDIMTV